MLLKLNKSQLNKLHQLSQDSETVEGLKILWLEALLVPQDSLDNKAAAHIALSSLPKLFTALQNINPKDNLPDNIVNLV